jgi:hypothetical protein
MSRDSIGTSQIVHEVAVMYSVGFLLLGHATSTEVNMGASPMTRLRPIST